MNSRGEFASKYGIYSFLIEAARSGVFGTLDGVRSTRLVEVLNYIAYGRSEANLAKDEERAEEGYL